MDFKKDLPLTSSHWGTYRAKVNNGKVTELIGWENDKDPSPIGPGIVDIHDNQTRIDKPMIRKSWIDNGPGTNNNLMASGLTAVENALLSEEEKMIKLRQRGMIA